MLRTRVVPPVIEGLIHSDLRSISTMQSASGEHAERVAAGIGEDPQVDPSGIMSDGRTFQDAADFKRLLFEDRDKFARAFIDILCTYALRRVLTVDDQEELQAIVAAAKKNQYRVQDIVRFHSGPVRTNSQTLTKTQSPPSHAPEPASYPSDEQLPLPILVD